FGCPDREAVKDNSPSLQAWESTPAEMRPEGVLHERSPKGLFREAHFAQPLAGPLPKKNHVAAFQPQSQENMMLSNIALISLSGAGSRAPTACSTNPSKTRYF